MAIDKKLIAARGFRLTGLYAPYSSPGAYRLTPTTDNYGEPVDALYAGFANIERGKKELGQSPKDWFSHAIDPGFSDRLVLIDINMKLEWAVDESMNWLSRIGYGMEMWAIQAGNIDPAMFE